MNQCSNMKMQVEKFFVVNDLLSFLMCKIGLASKDEILKCINEYYSEDVIAEAQKVLLGAIPIKKSTRHGRRVKHPDPLVAIYDCIKLIPNEDLPTFVCRNLNNVPVLSVKNVMHSIECGFKSKSKKWLENKETKDNLFNSQSNSDAIDQTFFKKEQKQMRSQISQMFSIITELKDGLQKFTEKQNVPLIQNTQTGPTTKRFLTHHEQVKPVDKIYHSPFKESEELRGDSIEEIEEDEYSFDNSSKLEGLALIQKLIDEDDEENIEEHFKKEEEYSFDDDLDYFDDLDGIKNFEEFLPNIEEIKNEKSHVTSERPEQVMFSPESGGNIWKKTNFRGSLTNGMNCGVPSANTEGSAMHLTPSGSMCQTDENSSDVPLAQSDSAMDGDVRLASTDAIKVESNSSQNGRRNNYQCHYCMESFTAYKKMRKHVASHCVVKHSSECILCHDKFPSRDSLREHFRSCLDNNRETHKKNICNICNTFYASDKAVKQHKNLHEEFRPHSCPHCPFKYLNKATLEAHVKNQHSPLNTFVCPFCFHSAISNASLSKHIKVHTGQAPFECRTCGQRTKTKFLLKRHIELHGPLRERKCDKCDFLCVGLNEYLKHRRKQHGKPIVCHICKQSFKQSNSFIRHYNLHTQKKPYKCDLCLYRAAVKETLRLHKLTHTGSDAHMCEECNVPCRNKLNLRRHLELYCKSRVKQE